MDEENRKTQGVKPLFVKTDFSIQQASQNIKKTLDGKNSLDHLIEKGCEQSNRLVIDIIGTTRTNYITKEIKNAFEYYPTLQEVFLLKRSRLIRINRLAATAKHFEDYFARYWQQQK